MKVADDLNRQLQAAQVRSKELPEWRRWGVNDPDSDIAPQAEANPAQEKHTGAIDLK
jgi:hypothetical protein